MGKCTEQRHCASIVKCYDRKKFLLKELSEVCSCKIGYKCYND